MEISFITQFTAKLGKEDELSAALQRIIAPVRMEEGCLLLNIYQDTSDKRILIAVETFASQESLELHKSMPYVKKFMENIPELVESQSVTYYAEVLP